MVEVGLVLVSGFVTPVPVLDDGVKEILEHLVGLLVTSHTAHGHDEGVTWGFRVRSEVLVPSKEGPGSWGQCRPCVCVCVCEQGVIQDLWVRTAEAERWWGWRGKAGRGRGGVWGEGKVLGAGQRRKSPRGPVTRY